MGSLYDDMMERHANKMRGDEVTESNEATKTVRTIPVFTGPPEDGWAVDFDFIKAIRDESEEKWGEQLSMESVESVIVALEKRGHIAFTPPSTPRTASQGEGQ